jgi:hypothetical protein
VGFDRAPQRALGGGDLDGPELIDLESCQMVACEERIPKNFGIFNVRLAAGLRSGDGWLADFSALARLTAGSIG